MALLLQLDFHLTLWVLDNRLYLLSHSHPTTPSCPLLQLLVLSITMYFCIFTNPFSHTLNRAAYLLISSPTRGRYHTKCKNTAIVGNIGTLKYSPLVLVRVPANTR